MKPLPTDKAAKQQLWAHVKLELPELMDLINTLEAQGITSKVVYIKLDGEEYTSDQERPTEQQLWQVDDALVKRVELAQKKVDFARAEEERKERLRIDAAKRKRGTRK